MKILQSKSNGFATAILLFVLLLAVVGYVGWRTVYQNREDINPSAITADETADKTVETSSDVESEIDELDTTNIDSELDTAELEGDLDSVL